MVKKENNQLKAYNYAIVVITASVILFILVLFVGTIPLWNDLKKNTEIAKTKREELNALETKLENLKNLSAKESEIKDKNAKLLAALPSDNDVPRLFVQFENIITQSGLNVVRVSGDTAATIAKSTDTTSGTLVVPVNYEVSTKASDYTSFKNAITNFEKALRLVSITEIKLSGTGENYTIIFSVTTYKRGA
jgi:Tfp pilus assembly protein PilO